MFQVCPDLDGTSERARLTHEEDFRRWPEPVLLSLRTRRSLGTNICKSPFPGFAVPTRNDLR
jgi:hypothetical protein